jgi:hypothetical protein
MLPLSHPVRLRTDLLRLEANIERARLALACPFSSSAEFDAALIAARRAAGIYGPRRHRKRKILSAAFAVAALALVALLMV